MDGTRTRGLSLRTRWTLLLVAFGVVPLLVLAFFTVRIQRAGLARAEKELEVAVVDQTTGLLETALEHGEETTGRVGTLLADGRIPDDDVRLELARAALAGDALLADVSVYGPDGKLIDTLRRGPGAPLPPAPPILDVEHPGRDVRWVAPIGPKDNARGWVLGRVAPAALETLVEDLSEARFGARGRIVVVDESLHILAGHTSSTALAGAPALGADVAGKDIFAAVKVGQGGLRSSFGMSAEFPGEGGEPMVGTLRSIPSRGWAVAVRRPEAEAFAALTASRRAFEVAALLVAAIALGLGAWLARRTTRPLLSLVGLASAYGRREFHKRSEVTSGDEVQVLGDALGAMATDLAASEKEIARRAAVEAGLSRFLPAELARSVAAGEASLSLGGERKSVTVLFADVASFTTFAEEAAPERVVAFLNELFGVLTEVTFRHGGMVDKFVGDCVMAVFGVTDATKGDHVLRALRAAEDMHRFVESSAPGWKESYGVDAKLGIGLATGDAVVGNLGTDTRMEFTAIGDAVNVAARLEALARPGQTLLTEEVVQAAGDGFDFNPLGEKPLRGKRKGVSVVELLS